MFGRREELIAWEEVFPAFGGFKEGCVSGKILLNVITFLDLTIYFTAQVW